MLARLLLLLCLLFLHGTRGHAQSRVGDNVRQLEYAQSEMETYGILYEMVETMLAGKRESDKTTALTFAKKLVATANRIGDPVLTAPAYYQLATAHLHLGGEEEAAEALGVATTQAMAAGDADLILRSVDRHNRLQADRGLYRDATKISQRALDYFVRQGDDNSISQLQAELAAEKAKLIRQQEDILGEEKKLSDQLEQLSAENRERALELEAQRKKLSKTQEQKAVIEERAAAARTAIKSLSREALEQKTLATSAREEVTREQLIRQEAELLAQRQSFRLYIALGAGLLLSLLAFLLYYRNRLKSRAATALLHANEELEAARNKSDELLGNILPGEIARELKANGTAKARSFPRTTVLFCDFVNFTGIAEELSPEELVEELDNCFKGFDRIVDEFPGVEKIKTIGDAYMVAEGLELDPPPPYHLIEVAIKMQDFLTSEAVRRERAGQPFFTGRIGLHTGPVVAGVVGARKFAYDIWGDTVNIASRMESESAPGRINISQATYELVQERFECSHRGKIEAKHKGFVDMYFVEPSATGQAGGGLASSRGKQTSNTTVP